MATVKKRKEKKSVYEGNVYIQATFNNTIVTVTDMKGNALSWSVEQKNQLHLLLSQLQKQLCRRLLVTVYVKFMCM